MKKDTPKTGEKNVTEKTFEKAMGSIAASFQRVEESFERHDKVLLAILDEMKHIRDDNKEFKKRSLENEIILVTHDQKIQNLVVRIEKLEAKVK